MAANVPAAIKNTLAIESAVNTKKMADNVTPLRTDYKIKTIVAVMADILLIAPTKTPTSTNSRISNP